MFTISQLAESVALDDVTDVLYRCICFSSYIRTDFETSTELERELDTKLGTKLVRQLNWSASICTLDPATHRIVRFLELVAQSNLHQQALHEVLEDNYWLKLALEQTAKDFDVKNAEFYLLDQARHGLVTEFISQLVIRYFTLQLSEHGQQAVTSVIKLSQDTLVRLQSLCETSDVTFNATQLQHLTFINILPMLIMIKLFERTLQTIRHDKLNAVALECDAFKQEVANYQPTADMFKAFLTFDEFVKPHILEQIGIEEGFVTNFVLAQDAQSETINKLFAEARSVAIVDHLRPHNILTLQQMSEYKEQKGIVVEITDVPPSNKVAQRLWQNLIIDAHKRDFPGDKKYS
jgi:uncharacterized membrane protein